MSAIVGSLMVIDTEHTGTHTYIAVRFKCFCDCCLVERQPPNRLAGEYLTLATFHPKEKNEKERRRRKKKS